GDGVGDQGNEHEHVPNANPGRHPLFKGGGGVAGFLLLHYLPSFSRSRISVSSSSSLEGLGAGAASSFFRWRRLKALTMQNTAKAMMMKLSTASIKLP